MPDYVNASPAKRFFIEMLIRDIRLEDAIVDLVDNSIDSLIRCDNIDLSSLLTTTEFEAARAPNGRYVNVTVRDDFFQIEDNCGGIDIEHAKQHVFRFGNEIRPQDAYLSVYGIGLKRAVLKIGKTIVVESCTLKAGFRVTINVDDFESDDKPWQFPIQECPAATNQNECGTKITVTRLTEECRSRLGSGSFENNIVTALGQSYSLFLGKFVKVSFNTYNVQPIPITVSNSPELTTSLTKEKWNDVDVTIIAGLQSLEGTDWRGKTAGWYIICNGRVVVFADRTILTGWGVGLPIFQPKHRGFIGIALFMSTNSEALPWTTTKRGVNAESAVFQYIRERMIADARPVIRFLDSRYSSIPVSSENTDDLEVKDKPTRSALQPVTVSELLADEPRRFSPSPAIRKRESMTSVQYRTQKANIERARHAIGSPSMSAGKVGSYALKYFLDNEAEG